MKKPQHLGNSVCLLHTSEHGGRGFAYRCTVIQGYCMETNMEARFVAYNWTRRQIKPIPIAVGAISVEEQSLGLKHLEEKL